MTTKANECPVCLDKYTGFVRKPVVCPYCEYSVCNVCTKRYLTEGILDAHCMSCRRAWNDEFLDLNFTKAFRTGPYKKHREDVLLDREIGLLPTRQPRVEAVHRLREAEGAMKKVNDELIEWERQRSKIIAKSNGLHARIARYTAESKGNAPPAWTLTEGERREPEKERAKFIMKCPASDCRGFLSSAYKCGTCQMWACADCLVIKGKEKDAEHTCDPGVKETVQLIVKESRPCPKCGERISKIDGCFAKNTPILCWSGRVKMSQDIKVGDELVGDDGKPRIVQEIRSGEDEMYEVHQRDGMNYIVNSKHKLCLKFSSEKKIHYSESEDTYVVRWFDREKHTLRSKKGTEDELKTFVDSLTFDEVIELTVEDYVNLSEGAKQHLMGYKANGIHWPKKEVALDPYVLGLWLGDGINDGMSFAIAPDTDPEILLYLLDWCKRNDAELVHDASYRFRIRQREVAFGRLAIGRGATTSECKGCAEKKCSLCDLPNEPYTTPVEVGKRNPLKAALDNYEQLKEKHIPLDYMVNDRETRLQLLAGIVDTDGYVSKDGKRIQIPQVRHSLSRQIAFLARSLGFVVHVDTLKKMNITFAKGGEKKNYRDQLRVSISGEHLNEIPCRIPRKKCVASTPNKDWMRTRIEVTPLGQGTYYGWSITENKRFLLSDTTVVRNCDQMWCVECHTAFSWNTGQIVTGVVHNPHYYEFLRKQGNGVAPRNAGDIPCGGVPFYHHLQRALGRINQQSQRTVMAIHRVTQEIQDYRLGQYQGHFNVNDNGDLGVQYLMREIDQERMKQELAKREFKRNKHLAIRAVLEMFVTTSTMMLNNMISNPPKSDAEFEATLVEYTNLRLYVNESLLNVSRMKTCSVPLFGESWEWKPFNKAPPKVRVPKDTKDKKVKDLKEDDSVIEISDDEELTEEQAAKQKEDAEAAKQKAEETKRKRLEALKKAREVAKAKRATATTVQTTPNA